MGEILRSCTVEPPLTTTSKEQPHAIKRPRTQVLIETTMSKATSQERPPLYSVQRADF